MKKPKMDLSIQGLKDYFFRHTEKLFFGLAVGLIGLFFWLGFKIPTYDETTPAAMFLSSQKADARMEDSGNWGKIAGYRTPITDACDRISSTVLLDSSVLAYQQIIGTRLRSLEKRTDPEFFKPGQLHTRYFRSQVPVGKKTGKTVPVRATPLDLLPESILSYPLNQKAETFAYRVKGSIGQKITNVDVVVGLALIDFEAQLEAYRETFQYQRGFDVNRDVPEYVFAEVQRKTESGEWEPISSQLVETFESMNGQCKDLIKHEHSIRNVTMDIPPFLGLDYRELVTLPEMETLRPEDFAPRKEEETKGGSETADPDDVFGSYDEPSGDEAEPVTAGKNEGVEQEEKTVKYRLIRFFDLKYKVPGEKYFYRVRLWFKDPNNPDNFTSGKTAADATGPKREGPGGDGNLFDGNDGPDDEGSGNDSRSKAVSKAPLFLNDLSSVVRQRLLQPVPDVAGLPDEIDGVPTKLVLSTIVPGEWVESTVPVSAARSSETFVMGPVDAPKPIRMGTVEFYQTEPESRIVVKSFQDDLGVFVHAETKQLPGSVLNFRAVAHVLHPTLWDVRDVFESGFSPNQKTGRYYETDAILVDCMGGQRQPFARRPEPFHEPAEIMIMDRNGRLIVRNDFDDETLYRHATFASARNQEARDQARNETSDDDKKGDDDKPVR